MSRYAELHAHSAFSFLDGANHPEGLVRTAREIGLSALGLLDHDSMAGIVRHAQAGRRHQMPTLYGSDLSTTAGSLPVIARSPRGYSRLVSAMSEHNLAHSTPHPPAHDLATLLPSLTECMILTGTHRGPLRRALGEYRSPHRPQEWDHDAASRTLGELIDMAGAENVAVELTLSGSPFDEALTEALRALADAYGCPLVATGAVRCARPADAAVADLFAATAAGMPVDAVRPQLSAQAAYLRGDAQMRWLHRRHPGAVDTAGEMGQELSFDLTLVAPELPVTQVPEGHNADSWLCSLVHAGAVQRYGTRSAHPRAWAMIDHELEVITRRGLSGYFLIVQEIVSFCRSQNILCQGRGSAANSAVCYSLGITAVDPVHHKLLFERFLSDGREGYPDIDIDIESCRREEVIAHVYERYGRRYAAQVATVIEYKSRSALRDMQRALAPSQVDDGGGAGGTAGTPQDAAGTRQDAAGTRQDAAGATRRAEADSALTQQRAAAVEGLPRHLGIHSGGMVLCDRPVSEVCPIRWGRTPGRTVVQWDKDDCAQVGLVKFDLLGLGMLTALRYAFESLEERRVPVPPAHSASAGMPGAEGPAEVRHWALHTLPQEDPAVYDLLCAADTIGVFQVESRAQMATLPRVRPRCFYDIVVEVGLIRPGPIQGDAVHPYIRRRQGLEPVTYPHPLLVPALERTLGVPLFQEQLMHIVMDGAGFNATQADELRQAMSSRRSAERMEALHDDAIAGMCRQGMSLQVAEEIFDKLRGFAQFGFPESHAFCFAHLVYASAWLKVHAPEDLYAAIIAAQPMGFWSVSSIVEDARRHGVRVLAADINSSQTRASVQQRHDCDPGEDPSPWAPCTPSPHALSPLDRHEHLAVRLGLEGIRGLGRQSAERIVSERQAHGRFTSVEDLLSRVPLAAHERHALAAADACRSVQADRRTALWEVGMEQSMRWNQPVIPGLEQVVAAPPLPHMSPQDKESADMRYTSVGGQGLGIRFIRDRLREEGVLSIAQVLATEDGTRVRVAGIVTHRQRPHTRSGLIFLNLEDETGHLNVLCSAGMWARYGQIAGSADVLIIRGLVSAQEGVCSVSAEHCLPGPQIPRAHSRNWR